MKLEETPIFKNNHATLKKTSLDKSGNISEYMTESLLEVVDFDAVKEEHIKGLGLQYTPCSVDALYIDEKQKTSFIEFKNGEMSKKEYNVYNKVYDSLLIFMDETGMNVSYCKENASFILVYNESKNSDEKKSSIGKYFYQKAKKKYVRFGMDRFEKLYFKEVFTYTEKEFQEQFVSRVDKALK